MSVAVEKRKVWTEAELQTLPDNGYMYEVVSGELVLTPKKGCWHADICVRLLTELRGFAISHAFGTVLNSSTGFWMRNRNCRSPGVSFISKERLRGFERFAKQFFPGAPDLAVEVVAQSNTQQDIHERLVDYFDSGTKLAWIIHLEEQFVEVCHSPIQRKLLGPGADLDGESLLPGFRFPIADLFKEWEW
jgi:Uma2 family endonuclease